MTKIIYISGVHGVGKTTIIKRLANALLVSGETVFVFPEFSFPPDIKIGTMKFQRWYQKQMAIRETLVDFLYETKQVDYILCDRHPIDVDIYTNRLLYLLNEPEIDIIGKIMNYTYPSHVFHYVLHRDTINISEDVSKRLENEEHREQWNEEDIHYIFNIATRFDDLEHQSAITFITNEDIEQTVEKILADIMMSDEGWIV